MPVLYNYNILKYYLQILNAQKIQKNLLTYVNKEIFVR